MCYACGCADRRGLASPEPPQEEEERGHGLVEWLVGAFIAFAIWGGR